MMRLVALAALSVSLLAPMAAEEPVSALQLKAAFLYKFTIFLEWPEAAFADSKSPIVIGVLGDKELAAATAETVLRREVRGRSFQVRSYMWEEDIEPDVHLLYLSPGADHGEFIGRLPKARAKAPHAFLVSDGEESVLRGAHLAFTLRNDRLQFLINLEAATAANIRISSKLLRLATIVDAMGERR
ncbi:MAG: YfiR family protein [Nitrospinae bacterium]|nr:YfiR family protein [Nitrospinota bacterium]